MKKLAYGMFVSQVVIDSLTCCSVALWTAIGDSHHAFMFNCPPAVSMQEMTCSLPCHRKLWDAPDMAAFIVRREGLAPTNGLQSLQLTQSIQSFIACLFDENWSLVEDLHPDVVSIESLFCLSNCKFYRVTFPQSSNLLPQA